MSGAAESPHEPVGAPAPDVEGRPAMEPLFTPTQIAFATLAATPLAGALLARANVTRPRTRVVVVVAGALVTAAIFGVDVWGAGPFTLLALPASACVTWMVATAAFGPAVAHAGARRWWRVLAVVALTWLALGAVGLGTGGGVAGALKLRAPSVDEALGDAVAHSAHERVRFRDEARRADAEEVARALARAGAFTGAGTLTVEVDRAPSSGDGDGGDGELRVSVRVPLEATNDDVAAVHATMKAMARALEPPRCVRVRAVVPSGDERASGVACP